MHGGEKEEGFHILIDPVKEFIQRWSVLQVRNLYVCYENLKIK